MRQRTRWEEVPQEALLIGLVGSVLNLGLLALAGLGHPLLFIPAVAGILGVLAVGFRRAWGLLLVFVGSLPGLLMLLTGVVYAPWGILYALPFLIPTLLMIWGAVGIAGAARAPEDRFMATAVTFRCGRCGMKFRPYPNAWNDAGFCSRKCLSCAR